MKTLLLLITFLLTSCNSTSTESAQTLHLNLSDDPVSLDPRQVRSLKDLTVVKQLCEGLMRIDEAGIPQPAIAESVTISDDRCTYTFTLRDSVWSEGSALTAYDFERSWNEAISPAFAADYAYMLAPMEHFTALDAHTLVVELKQPTPYFLELTAFPTYFPYKNEGVYNGPFQMATWTPQSELVLEKNGRYWDANVVKLDALAFTIIDDANTECLLFDKARLDWLGQPISNNMGNEVLASHKEEIASYTVAGTFWLKFNTEKAPFDRPEVRRALTEAIDRQEIITHILQGGQAVATGPLPPSMQVAEAPYFDDAKEMMLENLPTITLNYPPSERNTKIVLLLQAQWREKLGIKVELEAVENHLYRRNVREGNYQLGTGDWIADYNDPLAFLELFLAESSMNDTGWGDARFDALIDRSRVEEDRLPLLAEAEKILMDEMPIAPIYHYAFDYLKKGDVAGVILSPLGIADFKYASLNR